MDLGEVFAGAIWTTEELDAAFRALLLFGLWILLALAALVRCVKLQRVGVLESIVFLVPVMVLGWAFIQEANATRGQGEFQLALDEVDEISSWGVRETHFQASSREFPCPRIFGTAGGSSSRWTTVLQDSDPAQTMLQAVGAEAQLFEESGWNVSRFVGMVSENLRDEPQGWSFLATNGDYSVVLDHASEFALSYRYRVWPADCVQFNETFRAGVGEQVDQYPTSPELDRELLWSRWHDDYRDHVAPSIPQGAELVVGLGLQEVCPAFITRVDAGVGWQARSRELVRSLRDIGFSGQTVGNGAVLSDGEFLMTLTVRQRGTLDDYEIYLTWFEPGCGDYTAEAAVAGLTS